MSIALIDDIAYQDTLTENTIEYFMEKYKDIEKGDSRLPTVLVRKLEGVDPKTLFPETPHLMKGGTKYIIRDSRHRMVALKRLGHKYIKINESEEIHTI